MNFYNSILRFVSYRILVIQGDTLVLDRWLWLKRKLVSKHKKDLRILDVGCGTGAMTIGLCRNGFKTLGLTWDKADLSKAQNRAKACNANEASFIIQDARFLNENKDLINQFDIVTCTENIEHIINDKKLMIDMNNCLITDGYLYLTTPNIDYIPIGKGDIGPFVQFEDGAHVRKGYSNDDLTHLCNVAGFEVLEIDYISGYISQKLTKFHRSLSSFGNLLRFLIMLPLRPLIILDKFIKYPGYSITLIAKKK